MASLWQRFPGLKDVSSKIDVYPIKATFTAQLIAGRYVFDKAVQRVSILKLPQGRMGVIDGISFVSNIDQLIFSNAIDPSVNDGFFKMNVIRKGNNHPINLAPFMFASFSQGETFTSNFTATAVQNGLEEIELELDGALLQTSEITALGKLQITIQATINFFQCRDTILKG
jgi:hypothetical protein